MNRNNTVVFSLALHVHMAREVCFFRRRSVLVDQIADDFPRSVELCQVIFEHVMLSERLRVRVSLFHLVEVHCRSMEKPEIEALA